MEKDINKIINNFPLGAINWYNISNSSTIIVIASEKSSIFTNYFQSKGASVTEITWQESTSLTFIKENSRSFDMIFSMHTIEQLNSPSNVLEKWKLLLNKSGRLILGTDNRLGLRFFCGDRDPYTQRNFDGIENYRRVGKYDKDFMDGQLYSKEQLTRFLHEAGWEHCKFYSVLPNLDMPQLIYAEGTIPKESLDMRLFPKYNHPDSIFLEEQFLYSDIIKNGMFHTLANSFLIECSVDGQFDNADFITLSMDRGEERSFATIIRNNKSVEKKALFSSGKKQIQHLYNNSQELRKRGISVVDGTIENNSYVMPYIDAQLAIVHLRNLALNNRDRFIEEMDTFVQIVRSSSDIVIKEHDGVDIELLEKGFIDLVPWNSFYKDGKYLFFDQEFYKKNYPLDAIIYRIINVIYTIDIEQVLPRTFFWNKYKFSHLITYYAELENDFINDIRHRSALRIEMEKYQPNYDVLHINRQRINYSDDDFTRKFVNIFPKVQAKPIILFGSGNFTKRFLELYGKKYNILAIVDNNESNWNSQISGISIHSPNYILKMEKKKYCLIICIKNYTGVVKQLEQMGISDYGIYNPATKYPRSENSTILSKEYQSSNRPIKPYHTGYISGVFDLFHIGHINLLKKAKAQCEHLIVGLVSDEGIITFKKTEPFIPCEERKAVVAACRYVDEVVEIPLNLRGPREAYNLYQFDCQFSGSDYENDPIWLADRTYLQKHGSDLIFLPYTKQTSSSKIKAKLGNKDA